MPIVASRPDTALRIRIAVMMWVPFLAGTSMPHPLAPLPMTPSTRSSPLSAVLHRCPARPASPAMAPPLVDPVGGCPAGGDARSPGALGLARRAANASVRSMLWPAVDVCRHYGRQRPSVPGREPAVDVCRHYRRQRPARPQQRSPLEVCRTCGAVDRTPHPGDRAPAVSAARPDRCEFRRRALPRRRRPRRAGDRRHRTGRAPTRGQP